MFGGKRGGITYLNLTLYLDVGAVIEDVWRDRGFIIINLNVILNDDIGTVFKGVWSNRGYNHLPQHSIQPECWGSSQRCLEG